MLVTRQIVTTLCIFLWALGLQTFMNDAMHSIIHRVKPNKPATASLVKIAGT